MCCSNIGLSLCKENWNQETFIHRFKNIRLAPWQWQGLLPAMSRLSSLLVHRLTTVHTFGEQKPCLNVFVLLFVTTQVKRVLYGVGIPSEAQHYWYYQAARQWGLSIHLFHSLSSPSAWSSVETRYRCDYSARLLVIRTKCERRRGSYKNEWMKNIKIIVK